MTNVEDDLRAVLRAQAEAMPIPERPALDGDVDTLGRFPQPRWLIAAACLALVAVGVVLLALRRADEPEPAPPIASIAPDTTTPASTVPAVISDSATSVPDTNPPTPVTNGWVALDPGGSIVLVRPGEDARPLEIPGLGIGDDACPAWSPDGRRLLFGRVTGASAAAELVVVPISVDGVAGAPNVIPLDGFEALTGFDKHPCGIWAPDGRWVALAGTGDVWVVDTQTGAIRRLPDLRPSDLEWRPGTYELTIAGDMGTDRGAPTLSTPVSIYTLSTGDLHPLGSVAAAFITWSPDGSTLAYQPGESEPEALSLVDSDGANPRLLVAAMGEANHGIGPVWSPAGDRIAYQRVTGESGERHEVVLVDVTDGSETVIAPPQTDGPDGSARWYPDTVTWSPDGTMLLYTGWRQVGGRIPNGVITVAADAPNDVTVLSDTMGAAPNNYSHRWSPPHMWGLQPGQR